MTTANQFLSPHIALFGQNSRSLLVDLLKTKQYQKALIVTDANLVKLGIVEKVAAILDESGIAYTVYSEVNPNPTTTNVLAAFDQYQNEGCDLVLTIGGGSPQDCGKAVAILAKNGGSLWDYIKDKKPSTGAADIIAVTTTSGTGSECTYAYVISDPDAQMKYGTRDTNTQPMIAVNDIDLMVNLPPHITAATGMDALTHAVECLIGRRLFLMTRELALAAVKLVFEFLPTAVSDGHNLEARDGMATAQYLAGLAFGNSGVGMVHSMSHQLSAIYNTAHGLANAILLPFILEFERPECTPQLAMIARETWAVEAANLSEDEAAKLTINKIAELSKTVGTYKPLAEVGVKEADLDLLAEKTMPDGSLGNSARIPTKEEVVQIYREAL
jgi:alcohol dehydrogenase